MPDTALGKLLEAGVPEPPRDLDVTSLVQRARRRRRARAMTVAGAAVLAGVGAIATVTVATDRPHTGRSVVAAPESPSASPAGRDAPDVRGLDIDDAKTRLQQAGCMTRVQITSAAARVGTVVAQSTALALCDVMITVSSGPSTAAPPCTSVTVTAGPQLAAAGTSGFAMVFRNDGTSPCSLQGYPDVTATEVQTGRTVRATHESSYDDAADPTQRFVLEPGDGVSAAITASDNPVGDATSCTELHPIRVTVNGKDHILDRTLSNCSGMVIAAYRPGLSQGLG
ncbi:MAG: DUF4232 domain-containing protein [Mycobacteriales bacterium]